jgi:DNA replication protein DnaC
MYDFIDTLYNNYTNVTKMTIFNYFKTGNTVIDAIISTIVISIFGIMINVISDRGIINTFSNFSFANIKYFLYKKNCVIIEGKRCYATSGYSLNCHTSSLYSDKFKAVWKYIIDGIDNNETIFQIKEAHSNFQSSSTNNGEKKIVDMYMVFQNKHFKIDDNIFVNAIIEQEDSRDEREKIATKTDKIIIKIYSYVYNVGYLKKYIDNITKNYIMSIKNSRSNKKFIYFLVKGKVDGEDECKYNCWREDIFESYRTFKNMFFDGKNEIREKVNFFLNNRQWYFEKGIPYSLGICLHGPPGTGKTSFIKSLANETDRHIIIISFKIIKTKHQLEQFFFEDTYNSNNEKHSISFDNKIIVFEDIDCIGDIVLDRNYKKQPRQQSTKNRVLKNNVDKDNVKIGDVLQSICELNESGVVKFPSVIDEQPITLDDILNLWDGIRETPGRILIISTNHYNKLDPALIRPGRIDITHELSNASHNTIFEIYLHLFGNKIDKTKLKKVKEYFYSPAELINFYVDCKTEDKFMDRLLLNKK